MPFPEQELEDVKQPDAPSASEDQDVNTDAPSESEEIGEKTTLDIVKEALRSPEESPASRAGEDPPESEPKAESEPKEEIEADSKLPDEVTEEELKAATPNARRRIQELVGQRKEVESQVEDMRPKAEGFDKMRQYMQDADLHANEVDTGFELMALMKRDPAAALDKLTPIYQELSIRAGRTLPTDLAEDVNLGYISEQRAQELTQARAGKNLADEKTARAQSVAKQQQEQDQQTREQDIVRDVSQAVSAWEQNKVEMDPDWTLKSDRVAEMLELEVRRTGQYPQTPQQVVQMAEDALKVVEKQIKAYRPHPVAKQVANGEASGGRGHPEPNSILEIVQNRGA